MRARDARAPSGLAGHGGPAGAAALQLCFLDSPEEQEAAEREVRDMRRRLDELGMVRAAAT